MLTYRLVNRAVAAGTNTYLKVSASDPFVTLVDDSILIGVFLPTFAGQILDQTLILAAVVVALLWFVVGAARWLPKLGQMEIERLYPW